MGKFINTYLTFQYQSITTYNDVIVQLCVQVDNVSALLREMISSLSGESAALRTRMRAAGDELRLAAGRAAPAAAARASILADLRAPLALLAAVNDVSTLSFVITPSFNL